jgi:nitrogen fixation NifU-like protein
MEIEKLYTQIITEHSHSARNRRSIENPTAVLKGVNPSCGDEISIELREEGGVITDAAFSGVGCAISQASASMMIDLVCGKPAVEALRLCDIFTGMIKGTVKDPAALEELDEALALQGVSRMPARVKCAVLPWHTLEGALKKEENS